MSNTFTKTIFDCDTNTTITVQMDAAEIADVLARRVAEEEAASAAEAKAVADAEAKAALLERLGITEEEAALLVGGN